MAGNKNLDSHIFFANATTIGAGKDYMVSCDASQMNLKFVSTGTFQVKLTADISPKNTGNFYEYSCYKLPSLESASVITDSNYLYSVDLTAIDYLRVEIVSLAGELSVYGKVVG